MYLASRRARLMAAVVAAAGFVLPGAGASPDLPPAAGLGGIRPAATVRASGAETIAPPSAVWVVRPLGDPSAATSGGRFTTNGYERDPSGFGGGLRGVLTSMVGPATPPGATMSEVPTAPPTPTPTPSATQGSQTDLGRSAPATGVGQPQPSLLPDGRERWQWGGYGAANPSAAMRQLEQQGIKVDFNDAGPPRIPATNPAPAATLPAPATVAPPVTPSLPPPTPLPSPVTAPVPSTLSSRPGVLGPPPPPVPAPAASPPRMPLLPPTGKPVTAAPAGSGLPPLPSAPAGRAVTPIMPASSGPTLPPTGAPVPTGYRPAGYSPGPMPQNRSVVPAINQVPVNPARPPQQPVRPAIYNRPQGGAAYSKEPSPIPAAPGMSSSLPPAAVIRGASPASEVDESVEALTERIRKTCGGKAFGLDVRRTASGVLAVRFAVLNSSEAEPLVNLISSLPELDAWRVDFEVRVGS